MTRWWHRGEDDFGREIEAHIALETDRLIAEGMPPRQARTAAQRQFGNVTAARERFYEARRFLLLENLRRDLAHAARSLRRSPGFAATAVLTLAIGMAGTTTMFALVQGVLLRPFPMPEAERLVVGWKALPASGMAHFPFRQFEVDTFRALTDVFAGVSGAGYNDPRDAQLVEGDALTPLRAARVTGDFFDVLGLQAVLGRTLRPSDDAPGAEPILVVTDRFWQGRYGRDPAIIGRRVVVDDQSFVIVGVMPPDVEYPRGTEAWMTVEAAAASVDPPFRDAVRNELDLLVRLAPGVTVAQALEAVASTTARLETTRPEAGPTGTVPVLQSFADVSVGDVRSGMLILFGLVGLVLLIATTNVASLLLVRGDARRAELSLRAALGARKAHLASHVLAESALLVLLAAIVGLAVAALFLQTVLALVPSGLPRLGAIHIDAGVTAFVVALAFAAVALAGLGPALAATRVGLVSAVRGRAALTIPARRTRHALVAAQVALAVVVVAAAGLLTSSAWRLQATGTELGADSMTLVTLSLPQERYADRDARLRFLNDLVTQVEALPGVAAATPINAIPFSGIGWDVPTFTVEGQDALEAASNPTMHLEAIHPGYFETFDVAIARGRAFSTSDRQDSPAVAIVSEDVAAGAWPGENPLGQRLKMGDPDGPADWLTVVGVARQTRYRSLRGPAATLYVPAEQLVVTAQSLVVRTTSPGPTSADAVRQQVRSLDPTVRVTAVSPFATLLQQPLAQPRFYAFLVGLFALAALVLATVGLYAVVAASVRQRYAEIGIRMALGASARGVRNEVLRSGLRVALLGALAGLAVAIAGGRLVGGLLFEVSPADPGVLFGAVAALLLTAAGATYLPARTATQIDPVIALKA